MVEREACGAERRPSGAWTEELGDAFLALLRETGNARASARACGHRHLFYNRIRRDPAFRSACAAAVLEADSRLRLEDTPFLRPIEVKAMPPDEPDPPSGDGKPGRKRRSVGPEPVIRRTSNGRFQISYVREGGWTSGIEADFLARLGATGNFEASARAVGFHPRTVYRRLEQWPAFASACKEALGRASVQLDYKLVAYAHQLLRRPGEAGEDGEEPDDVPFDPEMAIRILGFLDRRDGRTTRGRRKGPPDRTFDEAVSSILAKIEAIERHEARMKAECDGKDGEGGNGDGHE